MREKSAEDRDRGLDNRLDDHSWELHDRVDGLLGCRGLGDCHVREQKMEDLWAMYLHAALGVDSLRSYCSLTFEEMVTVMSRPVAEVLGEIQARYGAGVDRLGEVCMLDIYSLLTG